MAEPSIASMFFGYCGIAAALFLFLSPVSTCRRIYKEGSIQSFSPLPYLAQLVESSWWALWAVAAGDRFEMLLNNAIGGSLMLVYVGVFAVFTPKARRMQVFFQIAVAMLLIAIGILCAVFIESPDFIFGVSAVTLNCLKYASPLSVVRLVYRTKSVEYMPLPFTLACLGCGVCWGLHGLFLWDEFIFAPNVAGVLFSLMQVAIYCWYRGSAQASLTEDSAAKDDETSGAPSDATESFQADTIKPDALCYAANIV